MAKRSQADMEFFLTWGWAIAALIILIVSLSYSGYFDNYKNVPELCMLSFAIQCVDYSIKDDQIILSFKNNMKVEMDQIEVKIENCDPATGPVLLSEDETGSYTASCSLDGRIYNGKYNFSYRNVDTQLSHREQGEVTARIN